MGIAVLCDAVDDDCFGLFVNLVETALFGGLILLDNLNDLALPDKELLDSHLIFG